MSISDPAVAPKQRRPKRAFSRSDTALAESLIAQTGQKAEDFGIVGPYVIASFEEEGHPAAEIQIFSMKPENGWKQKVVGALKSRSIPASLADSGNSVVIKVDDKTIKDALFGLSSEDTLAARLVHEMARRRMSIVAIHKAVIGKNSSAPSLQQ